MGDLVEGAAHGVAGQRRKSRLVHLVAQIIEHAVVVQHVRVVLRGDRDLVGDAPADDGRVIVILDDQLLHLGDRILPAAGHVLGDVRDLRPYHHAALIAQVVEVLIVLIVREAHRVDAHLADHIHILEMHLLRQRVADALAVLVAGYAVERVFFAVEIESRLGIGGKIPHAESCLDAVLLFSVHRQDRLRRVEIRVPDAVPEPYIVDAQFHIPAGRLGSFPAVFIRKADFTPFRVQYSDCDLSLIAICEGLNLHISPSVPFRGFCRHLDAGTAKIVHVEVLLIYSDQIYIPVNSAVESEVCFLGIHSVISAVVGPHFQVVLTREVIRDIPPEGGVSAVMGADLGPVQFHLGRGVDAAEFQVDAFLLRIFRSPEFLLIQAGPPPVIISSVLSIDRIPCMRHIHRDFFSVRPGEQPVRINLLDLSHGPSQHCKFFCNTSQSSLFYSYAHCIGAGEAISTGTE